jgi:hypothetical protein
VYETRSDGNHKVEVQFILSVQVRLAFWSEPGTIGYL